MRATEGGRTLTLDELVATPDGTELRYQITGLTGDEGYTPKQDIVAIRTQGIEHVLARGAFSFSADTVGIRPSKILHRSIRSTSVIPARTGPIDVAIAIQGVGEFHLLAELKSFGPATDAPRLDVNTSATHEGITVTVHGVGAGREDTAVEIEVAVGDGACCAGIGGFNGHRQGPTALWLTDDRGRTYAERWQKPGGSDCATLALFEPIHPDARRVELTVPYVFVEERCRTEDFALPIVTPVEAQFGRYEIRLLATEVVAANPAASPPAYREPALGVDLDLGGWQGDRRVVLPGRVRVDGDFCNLGYRLRGMFNASKPEPVDRLELTGARSLNGKSIGFMDPSIQVRGPWRIGFALD